MKKLIIISISLFLLTGCSDTCLNNIVESTAGLPSSNTINVERNVDITDEQREKISELFQNRLTNIPDICGYQKHNSWRFKR